MYQAVEELRKLAFTHEFKASEDRRLHKETMYVVPLMDAISACENTVSFEEKELLEIYSKLTVIGRAKVMEYVEMISLLPEYQQEL